MIACGLKNRIQVDDGDSDLRKIGKLLLYPCKIAPVVIARGIEFFPCTGAVQHGFEPVFVPDDSAAEFFMVFSP